MTEGLRKLTGFFREVWRRRVLQVAIPYGVGAWLLVQVAEIVLDAFEAPAWIMQGMLTILVLGFPVAVVLAWVFDITPKGSLVVTQPFEEDEPEPEPAPALSLEMGDSERRQITMLNCVYEIDSPGDPEVDPEHLRDSLTAMEKISRELAERFNGYQLPSGAEELTLVFGYPQAHADDARRAVTAGLALIEDIASISEQASGPDDPSFSARVGVATGLVVVDESGSDDRGVTIVGQAPRMAAWLQGLAPSGKVAIGPQTQKLVANHFQIEPLGTHSQAQFGGEITIYSALEAAPSDASFDNNLKLTGRDDEMRLLEDRWENVLDGDGQFVVLQGEAGIGKSSLVRSFTHQALDGGNATVIPCHCSPYERLNPLSPIIQVLQGPVLRFDDKDTSAERLQKLQAFLERQSVDSEEAVPLLASLLSLDTGKEFKPLSGSAQIVRMQTLELILDMISAAAGKRPVLMILEDLHWADPSTLEMVNMMVDRGPAPGLFVLFSARPEFQADWTKRSFVLVQELQPLGSRNARALLESTEGSSELPPDLVDRIIQETDGNPLFIQELTRAVLESDAWRASVAEGRTEEITWLEIPATLQDSLAARIDNLGETKALLQLCSVLGREFGYDLLRAVSGTENESALKEELTRLVNSELLFQRGLFRNLTYTFKHILIQETAYNSLLKSKRRELHGRTAQILEQEFAEVAQRQPALLAYHYTEAGDLEKAIPNWTLASRQSLARFANLEAIEQSRRGIDLLNTIPQSSERAAQEVPLQSVLGTALLSTHGYAHPEVRKTFTKALGLCEQIGDAPQLFQVAVGLWMYHIIAARFDEALDLSQRLVRISETTQNPAQQLQARYCLAFILYYRGDFLAAKSHLETALEAEVDDCDYAAQSASGDDTRIHVRVLMALVHWHLGFPKTAERLVRDANTIARGQKHPWGLVFASFYSSWFYQMQGDAKQTLKYADEAAKIAEENGFRFWLPLTNFMRTWAENRKSDSTSEPMDAAGVEKMKTCLDIYRGIGSGAGVTYLALKLAEDYIGLGMHEQAIEQLESAWTALQDTGEDFFEPEYYRLHGRVHLDRFRQTGQPEELDEAAEYFKKALARARRQESKALELRAAPYRAEALSLQGNHEFAVRLLTGISQRFEEFGDSEDCARAAKTLKKLEKKIKRTG